MKEYKIMDNKKFQNVNKKQKKDIILKSMTSVVLAESSLAFLAAGLLSLNTDITPVVPALLGVNTLATAVMTYACAKDAQKCNKKNTALVDAQVKALNDKLYDTENQVLAYRK